MESRLFMKVSLDKKTKDILDCEVKVVFVFK